MHQRQVQTILAKSSNWPLTFYLNYRRVTPQSGLKQWFKKSGYGFSGEQTFASKGSGAFRVDFDCTLILQLKL